MADGSKLRVEACVNGSVRRSRMARATSAPTTGEACKHSHVFILGARLDEGLDLYSGYCAWFHSIDCNSDIHKLYMAYAFAMILVYPFGT